MIETGDELFDDLCHQLDAQDKVAGINQMDILNLPSPLDNTLTRIIRKGSITVSEFANGLHLTLEQGEYLIKMLVDKGYLHTANVGQQTVCKIHFARNPKNKIDTDVWDWLDF